MVPGAVPVLVALLSGAKATAMSFSYQWQRDNQGGGVYSDILGATSTTYVLTDADDGCHVRCVVTAINGLGSTPANSNSTALVTEPVPTNSVAPTASGTATVNASVSSSTGTWANMAGLNPSFTYQWQDSADGSTGWANIGGATGSGYAIVIGELAKFLRCVVTAHNTGGTAAANTNVLGPVAAAASTSAPSSLSLGVGLSVHRTL